jgi:hypothetical protein
MERYNKNQVTEIVNKAVGMLMELWALKNDPESRRAIHETIEQLRHVEESISK